MPPTPLHSAPAPAPRRAWRARARAGWIGLAIGLAMACVFTLWPQIDLWVSARCTDAPRHWIGNDFLWVRALYQSLPKIGWLYFVSGVVAAGLAWARGAPGPFGARWTHRLATLAIVSALGSGVIVNLGLKNFWGRARPQDIVQFAGTKQFTPALQPTDQCERNCSFVSGHSASGFVLMSVGLLGSVRTRRRWLLIGLAAGTAASAGRILQGGHFLSDTLFSGLVIWATGWLVREAWLRIVARRRRPSLPGHGPQAGQA